MAPFKAIVLTPTQLLMAQEQIAIMARIARDRRSEAVAEPIMEPILHSDRRPKHHRNNHKMSEANTINNDRAGPPTSEDEAPAISGVQSAATDREEYNKINFVDKVPPGFKELITEHYVKFQQQGGVVEGPLPPPRDPFSDLIERLIQERIASQDPNTIARHFQVPDHPAAMSSQEATTSTALSTTTALTNEAEQATTAETECVGFQPCIDIVKGMNAALDRLIDGPLASINRETIRMQAILEERRNENAAYEKENAAILARIAKQERHIALYQAKDLIESRRELAEAKAENARLEEELKQESKKTKARAKRARAKANKKAKAEAEQDATAETGGEGSEEVGSTTREGTEEADDVTLAADNKDKIKDI